MLLSDRLKRFGLFARVAVLYVMKCEAAVKNHQFIIALLHLCDSPDQVVVALLQLVYLLVCTGLHRHQNTCDTSNNSHLSLLLLLFFMQTNISTANSWKESEMTRSE